MTVWYLSFADTGRPEGTQWLGACYVNGINIVDAARAAHALGCNPGGQIMGGELPDEIVIPEKWVGKLLNEDGLQAVMRDIDEDDTLVPFTLGSEDERAGE